VCDGSISGSPVTAFRDVLRTTDGLDAHQVTPSQGRALCLYADVLHPAGGAESCWPGIIREKLPGELGFLLGSERAHLGLDRASVCVNAQLNRSVYNAIDRSARETNLSTFIVLAWVLDQDPRDLLGKLLLGMGFEPGSRPVLTPQH